MIIRSTKNFFFSSKKLFFGLSVKLLRSVERLNALCGENDYQMCSKQIDRATEQNLVELVLHICKSGFDLFQRLYDVIKSIDSEERETLSNFMSNINEFFCEWCKSVANKFRYKIEETPKMNRTRQIR